MNIQQFGNCFQVDFNPKSRRFSLKLESDERQSRSFLLLPVFMLS